MDHFEKLSTSPVRLLINTSRSQSNADLGYSMKSVCSKYYDLGLDYLGAIDFDNAVWQSIRNREPVLVSQPFTPLAGQFLSMCKHLIAPDELRAVG
jgi:flagellar biosynthesis protein FlhG